MPKIHFFSYLTPKKDKENVISCENLSDVKKSRIPDIRSKVSPAREIHDVDGGYKSDYSAKSISSATRPQVTKIPSSSKLPVSPQHKLSSSSSGSRIPTLLTSPNRQSTESLDDWDTPGPGRNNKFSRVPSESDLTCSSSSNGNSPEKRYRDENVRTSPDGEPGPGYTSGYARNKRGGSPSKIPIAGAYLRSSCEDLLSPSKQPRQMSDDDDDMIVGGGEGMAESVLGKDFLKGGSVPTEVTPHKSKIPAPSITTPR